MGKNCLHNVVLCYGLVLNIISRCVTIPHPHKRAWARASRARARDVRERARACEGKSEGRIKARQIFVLCLTA